MQDHVARTMDSAEGLNQAGDESMLQDLHSVHLAIEQMEAAFTQQSTSPTSDMHMLQAVEVIIRLVCGCMQGGI